MEAFFWDPGGFETNSRKYLSLLHSLPRFLQWLQSRRKSSDERDTQERTRFFCNAELLSQIHVEVLSGFTSKHLTGYTKSPILVFLSLISSDLCELDAALSAVTTTPKLDKSHFNAVVSEQVRLVGSNIHKERSGVFTFFSFNSIWYEGNQEVLLHDANQTEVKLEVVIADNEANFEEYAKRKERVFDADDPKHDTIEGYVRPGGKRVSPLSCYRGREVAECQRLLDQAIPSGSRLYNYDTANGVWVVFAPSVAAPDYRGSNKYHGYDETNEQMIPTEVRKIKDSQ
jgi:hypothetical protein